jgi:hypothetical protein
MNREHRQLYKNLASVVAVANESLPVDEPIMFSGVQEVAYRELQVSDDEQKALDRATDFVLAQIGENFEYTRDLDLFSDDYLHNQSTVEGKLAWLSNKSYLDENKVALIASAVDQQLDDFSNIHAWKRLEILRETGQISEGLYNLVIELEKKAAEDDL